MFSGISIISKILDYNRITYYVSIPFIRKSITIRIIYLHKIIFPFSFSRIFIFGIDWSTMLLACDCPTWTLIELGHFSWHIGSSYPFHIRKCIWQLICYSLQIYNIFELLVHIVLFEDLNKVRMMHSNLLYFPVVYSLPLMLEALFHQIDILQIEP